MTEAPEKGMRVTPLARPEQNFDLLACVQLRVSVEVGAASVKLSELLNLAEGSVVELDRQVNDLLDIFANGTLIAKGEIVTVEGRYGIRIVEVVAPDRQLSGFERRS
ncbi:MAG: flagellar motor switch protein FliN [Pseudomonadota bacterium]